MHAWNGIPFLISTQVMRVTGQTNCHTFPNRLTIRDHDAMDFYNKFSPLPFFFFLEYAGELHIIVLSRRIKEFIIANAEWRLGKSKRQAVRTRKKHRPKAQQAYSLHLNNSI